MATLMSEIVCGVTVSKLELGLLDVYATIREPEFTGVLISRILSRVISLRVINSRAYVNSRFT